MKLWQDLQERRIAQFFLVYCAVGWAALQAFDQVADRGVVPEVVYRVVLTVVLCGLPGVLIVSWFHGAKGHQSVPVIEKALLGLVGVLALVASGWVVRAELGLADAYVPPDPSVSGGRAPWEDSSRVAILYFDSRGGGEDAELLATGLTEHLIEALASAEGLNVVSRHGSERYRSSSASPDSIGRALGVGTLVSGSLTVAGERVRIEAAVVGSRSDKPLERTRIERSRHEVIALADDLVEQVALLLEKRIGAKLQPFEDPGRTRVAEAWELLQRAEWAARRGARDAPHGWERLVEADSLLARAEALDPDWGHVVTRRGWLSLERSRVHDLELRVRDELTREALAHAERVLLRAPGDPDALELRATARFARYMAGAEEAPELLRQVEADLRAVVADRPGPASAWAALGELLHRKGEIPRAKLAAAQAYRADPFHSDVNLILHRLASTSWELADHVESKRYCDQGLDRFPDDFRFRECQLRLFALRDHEPDVPAAWARYQEYVERVPAPMRELHEKLGLMYMAQALARAELPDSARSVARRGRAEADVDPRGEVALMEAIALAWVGDHDDAARRLDLFLSADPGRLDRFRRPGGEVPWFLRDFLDHPGTREILGGR